ncbi:MAG: hypothetical protein JSR92_19025 [Proteobacteria bacterium]|nr:hypothetical protein [Pseudomonadota bacterium]
MTNHPLLPVILCGGSGTHVERCFLLQKNESTYIPLRHSVRQRNLVSERLELIEIQFGDYLVEDDIVRIDGANGRAAKGG